MIPMMQTRRESKGFSLIETLVAIVVFGLVTVGIAPLIVSSMRGSTLARSYTVAKNLGLEAMERARGLPYFDAAPGRDVLDLYYPNLATGYDPATHTFTTTCTATTSIPAASGARACPPDHPDGTSRIPAGYTLTYVARFVIPSGTTAETLTTQAPLPGYDSASPTTASPRTLTELTVTVTWDRLGRGRDFVLSSLLGQRKLSVDRLSARASIDFVIQALTSFEEEEGAAAGRLSSIKGIAGRSSSDIEVRGFAAADQDTRAGELILTQNEFAGQPGATLAQVTGAEASLHAPPNTLLAPPVTKTSQTVTHGTEFGSVAHLGNSLVNESATPAAGVSVTGELPKAAGNFALTTGHGERSFWIRNQQRESGLLGLSTGEDTQPFYVQRVDPGARISGNTYAEATAPSPPSTRKVHATAAASSSPMHLFPTSFASRGVVRIEKFVMTLECKSTGVLTTAVATGTWSATVRYWNDGSYTPLINIGGSTDNPPADPLAGLGAGPTQTNPKVYTCGLLELGCTDRYLFDDPANSREGYLKDWAITTVVPASKTATRAEVDLGFAIDIQTAPTDTSIEETAISLTVGKASCSAEDQR